MKTRAAYAKGDKDELRRLAEVDYSKAIKLADIFANAFEKQWFIENKTCGFDVQDLRLGGLIRRLGACRKRLLGYTTPQAASPKHSLPTRARAYSPLVKTPSAN